MSGFFGSMTILPMWCVSARPIGRHVRPASADLKTPVPAKAGPLCLGWTSPVPTQTTSGLEGATAMSPIANADSCSKTGSHVMPLLVVFQTLPPPGPT